MRNCDKVQCNKKTLQMDMNIVASRKLLFNKKLYSHILYIYIYKRKLISN